MSVYLFVFVTGVITAALPALLIIGHLNEIVQRRDRWTRFWERQRRNIHIYNRRQREGAK